jgi:acylphosphatase
MAVKVVQAHIFVEGRVQGVFYRAWIAKSAKKLGIKGWVKNRDDGLVEAIFIGPKPKIEIMLKECRKGPRLAKIKRINVYWEEVPDRHFSFEILR